MIFLGLKMLDKEIINQARQLLREKVGIKDFLLQNNIAPSKSYDNKHVYKCPIHAGDNSPSFYVYEPEDGHDNFFCYGCKKWGDVVDLKCFLDRIGIGEACALLCDQNNIRSYSSVSESDLLESEIDNWERKEKSKESFDVSAMCFCMGRMFRNMIKIGKVEISEKSVLPLEVFSIMRDFDKSIRLKDYDSADKFMRMMQERLENARLS